MLKTTSNAPLRRALLTAAVAVLLLAFAAPPALAQSDDGELPYSIAVLQEMGLRTADLLIVRPIAAVYVAGGTVGYVVGSIFMYTFRTAPAAAFLDDTEQTGYRDEMLDNFVRIPGQFAFQRRLGDFSDGLGPG